MTSAKYFMLSVLALFALVLAVGSVSAAQCLNLQTTPPVNVNHNQGTFSVPFILSVNSSCSTANRTNVQWNMASNVAGLTFTAPAVAQLEATETRTGTFVFTLPAGKSGSIFSTITVSSDQDSPPKSFALNEIKITAQKALVVRKLTDISQTQNGTIEIENTGNIALSGIQLSSAGDFTVTFSENSFSLAAGAKKTVTIAPVGLDSAGFGGESTTITARASDSTQSTLTLTVGGGSFCRFGEVGTLDITSIDMSNNGEGDDEEWQLLDEIEVEIDVENTGNDDIDDIIVEIGLFDSNGNNQIGDLVFDNADEEEFEIGDLDDGDEETATFTFRVPADFDEGNYKFTAKAYSDQAGEDEQCTSTSNDFDTSNTYTQVDVKLESDEGKFITFDNIDFAPLEGTCGETVTMSFTVFNIGDEDIQDRVKINLKNTELGVNQFFEILSDLDQGDEESATLTFVVPQSATDKFYNLALSAEYDYRNGIYREETEEDKIVPFRVIGCGTNGGNNGGNGGTGQSIAVINAALESDEAVAGEEVVVSTTITNLKTTSTTFTVSATGYSSWAELDNSGTELLQLDSGESGEVTFTFIADEDSAGRQSFDIEVRDTSGNVQRRTVDVNVEGTGSSGSGFNLGGSTLWILVAVNVILVILIIVVIVRVARR